MMIDAPGFDAGTGRRYAAIRALVPDGTAVCVLHIGAEQTGVAVGHASAAQAMLALAIGSQRTAREFFRQAPPSPLELETAIVTVEDEVTRARALIPAGCGLYTMDAAVREIALLSGVSAGTSMRLSVQAMERTFDRLAALALGRPASHEGLPASSEFAATLLILREFMHHLQFADITFVETDALA